MARFLRRLAEFIDHGQEREFAHPGHGPAPIPAGFDFSAVDDDIAEVQQCPHPASARIPCYRCGLCRLVVA